MSFKIAAAYIRVSTDDQTEYSPDSQLKAIREYAKRNGYIVPDEYVYQDDGISGKSASKRPAFRLMIAAAKAGSAPPFDAIIVWKYSRFSRNQEEAIVYKNLLRKLGVDVLSISEPSNDSPFSSLIERIIEWMDQYYLINLAEEVRRGMREKATRGECMGTAPFGYTVKDKSFVPNEHADTVRYLFERYASGAGCRELAMELGAKGVRTRRGNVPDNRWVQYILGNPTYIGKIRWSTEGHANYSRANYDSSNVLVSDGQHPPIIGNDLWDRVQARLAQRDTEPKNVNAKKPNVYMLKGLIRCGSCGATLTNATASGMQCHKYARGTCYVSHYLSVAKANKAVIEYLEQIVAGSAFHFSPAPAPKTKITRDWDALIRAEEKKLSRARSALLEGVFTTEEYRDTKAEIEATLSRLRVGADAEADTQPETPDPALYRAKTAGVLEIIKSADAGETAKNKALRSIIDKIVYNKPEGTFDFYFCREL